MDYDFGRLIASLFSKGYELVGLYLFFAICIGCIFLVKLRSISASSSGRLIVGKLGRTRSARIALLLIIIGVVGMLYCFFFVRGITLGNILKFTSFGGMCLIGIWILDRL